MFTKNKIINHITQKGKKTKSEKILNKSIKELQKTSKKPIKKLIQLSIILSTIMFKTRTIKNKKNRKKKAIIRPIFIPKQNKRFSFAIKLIINTAKANYTNYLHNKLKEELFLITQLKSNLIKTKKELEKQALNKKHLFKYYRWI
jgi:ribosomal protein S7